ncbi:MAG: Gfo/Idh/MocA family oxidoreductase [Ferruginibacter sp.]
MQNKPVSRRKFLIQTVKATAAFTIVPRFVLGGKGYTSPSDQLTLGFIGTGKQGRGLVNDFAKKAQVLAGSDADAQKLALFKTNTEKLYADLKNKPKYSGFTGYADFREMLERKDIDAVVVATPDHWHAAATVMAANAKKHVYCEKPLAHSVEEGRAMVNAVRKNNVVLQTGSMQRSSRDFRIACELVRNGYVGDIKEVLVSVGKAAIPCDLPPQPTPPYLAWDMWLGPAQQHAYNSELSPPVEQDVYPNWRVYREYGGGSLSDWGAHMFDIAQWALNKDKTGPVKFFPPDGKDFKVLTMAYDDGVIMKHEDFGRDYAVRFIGTKGSLDVSRSFLDSKPGSIARAIIRPNETHLYESSDHQMDWLQAIKKDTAPICDVETGHRTSSVCCLANITYWLNRPLQWDPVKEQFKNDEDADKLLKAQLRDPWKIV